MFVLPLKPVDLQRGWTQEPQPNNSVAFFLNSEELTNVFRIANDGAAKRKLPSECMLIFTAPLSTASKKKTRKPPE